MDTQEENRRILVGGRQYFVVGAFRTLTYNGIEGVPMFVAQEQPGSPIVHVRVQDAVPVKTIEFVVSKY